MKIFNISIVVLTFLAGMTGAWLWLTLHASSDVSGKPTKESVYERVMRTQTIRCGYGDWPPFIIKDPNSGQMSGIFYDYMAALGEALHLRIEWAEQVNPSDFIEAIKTGRVDGVCASIWPNAARAREIDFVRPIYYSPMYVYARADDSRFDNNLLVINDPSVTVVTQDGEMASLIVETDFPKAKTLRITQQASLADFFVNIATGKGDVTFSNPTTLALYNAQNPGKVKRVPASTPIRVFGGTIAIAHGQDDFRRMLDLATEELLSNGMIEKILAKYEKTPGEFLRVAPSYQNDRANLPRQ